MKTPSSSSETPRIYDWFVKDCSTPFTNDSNDFLVIVGATIAFGGETRVTTPNPPNLIADRAIYPAGGSAVILYLPRHMLVPPKYIVTADGTVFLIRCKSLQEALQNL